MLAILKKYGKLGEKNNNHKKPHLLLDQQRRERQRRWNNACVERRRRKSSCGSACSSTNYNGKQTCAHNVIPMELRVRLSGMNRHMGRVQGGQTSDTGAIDGECRESTPIRKLCIYSRNRNFFRHQNVKVFGTCVLRSEL
ncbi:hypothetical protein TNIN_454101 [Trichonephila inaurata madagascariensis]|uniref:Uncharacterized protein n=1 Tax=Trichonephila inaurata madagascariensis TaxID=2747483 RepID=A0A8X6YNE0_9ARAC|nr:hypothetical protein TNIN_454101 [Trichonephila inaurata madagascariensis]